VSASERLHGQVAIVSGGASGIGLAVVDRFLAEGACVGVLDRQAGALRDLQAAWPERLVVVGGDVRDGAAHEAVLEATSQRFGAVDTYVANAGIHDMWTRLEDIPLDQLPGAFEELFAVDVLGYLLGARVMAGALRAAHGSMIFTASSSSRYAGGGGPLYVAAKHAVVGLVRQLAHELAPDVRVNAIAPGATSTGLSGLSDGEVGRGSLLDRPGLMDRVAETVPLGFVAEPGDHASLYVLLASADEAPFMTGTVLPSDGGLDVRRSGRHHRAQRVSGTIGAGGA
jgi:NAD(P)-dependent dehydrogenase (short-subunit alcohol dehydrogenase family)